jgi:WD40 repeat protein
MAPEQAAGAEATARSDVYALGAIVLDVLRGGSPRPEMTAAATGSGDTSLQSSAAEKFEADIPEAPADLRSIVRRAMASAPADRYPGARALGDDLRRFLAGAAVHAHRYTAGERTARWLATHRRLLGGGVLALLVVLAVLIVFLARESGLRSAAERAQAAAEAAQRSSDSERERADRQTLALLEQQGRTELTAGKPLRALPYLAEAYRRAPDAEPIRWLLTGALRAADALEKTYNVRAPPDPDGKHRDWRVYSVSLPPDDSELVTGQKFSIGFWEPWTGTLKRRVPMRTDGHQILHSGDGTSLLTIIARNAGGRRARILDATSAAETRSVPVDGFEWQAWSPDGSVIAVIDAAGKVDVWSTMPAARTFSFQAGRAPTYLCLAISPDGSTLAARGDGELVLVTLKTREVRRLPAPGDSLIAVAFSPDSRLVAATTVQGSIRLWDVTTGVQRRRLEGLGEGFAAPVFSADAAYVISIGSALHLWDLASTIRLASIDITTGQNAVFARKSPRALLLTADGEVTVLGVPTARWAHPLPDHRGRTRGYYAAGGSVIVTIDEGDGVGRLRRWSAADGRLLGTTHVRWNVTADIAVSRDGAQVAVVGSDDRPIVVDAATGAVLTTLDGAAAGTRDVAFSRDGRFLATAGSSIDVWALPAGTPTGVSIRAFKDAPYSSVSFSPDGRRLVSGVYGWDGLVWDAITGFLLQILSDGFAPDVRYSEDGRHILTSGAGPRFPTALYDVRTSRRATALETDGTGTHAAAVSPDGSIVAAVNRFGVVRITSAKTGATLRLLEAPSEQRLLEGAVSAFSLDFSPDGRRLLATGDGYAMLWNVEVDTRTPDEVDAVMAAKSPWKLVDGRLVRRE